MYLMVPVYSKIQPKNLIRMERGLSDLARGGGPDFLIKFSTIGLSNKLSIAFPIMPIIGNSHTDRMQLRMHFPNARLGEFRMICEMANRVAQNRPQDLSIECIP